MCNYEQEYDTFKQNVQKTVFCPKKFFPGFRRFLAKFIQLFRQKLGEISAEIRAKFVQLFRKEKSTKTLKEFRKKLTKIR